jgi:hypothetical protein
MPAAQLNEEAIQRLVATTRDNVTRPGEDGYDAGRTIWNGVIDRRPARSFAALARPQEVREVDGP